MTVKINDKDSCNNVTVDFIFQNKENQGLEY